MRKATDVFALLVGAFLLIEGVWGLTSPVVFGVLTTNTLHAIIHIVLGIVGIAAGWQRRARGFLHFPRYPASHGGRAAVRAWRR